MSVEFPHPIPSSWYSLAPSHELAPGEVRALEILGRPLVLFRTEAGRAHVFDAHCPHLGAHLGVGGKVIGETLRCPFHGWSFDGRGRCVGVDYAKRLPSGQTRVYPTQERNGFVWTWYHPEDATPDFEIPALPQITDPDWVETFRNTWVIRTQIQEMGENGVDSAHFPTVHGAAELPRAEVSEDGAHRRAIQYTVIETSKGRAQNVIDVHSFGMGFGFTHFTGICETLSMNLMTPIDDQSTRFSVVFLQRREDSDAGVARAICRDLEKQVGEDIPIWENKLYRANPVLCDGDGPIADYRRWCRQFYVTSDVRAQV